MYLFKFQLFVLFSTLAFTSLNAQELTGTITEKNDKGDYIPLAGVNVYWAETTIGTTTDVNGHFKLVRFNTPDLKLVISFVGYQNDTLIISPDMNAISHTLSTEITLQDVTIHGYAKGSHFDRLNPIQTQVVSQHELKRAACCNLSESFETNASVDVSYSDAVTGAKQIQLLGLAGIYTQLQAENVPILRGLGSTFGLAYVPGNWLESIQVSKGTASVANGYESITGQINIEYKKSWGEEKFFVNTYVNDLGMVETNANYAYNLNDKLSTMILAHAENLNSRIDHNMDSFLDHPLVNQYNLYNRWKYQGENIESQFDIKYLNENRISGQKNYKASMDQSTANPFGIDISTSRLEAIYKIGYIFDRPSTSIGLILSGSKHDQNSIFGLKDYNTNQLSFFSNMIFVTYLGSTNHTIKSGLSFSFDDFDEKLDSDNFDRSEKVPGAYFEYTYKHLENLTLMGGVRYDYHNRFGGFVTPRVHFRYQPVKQITFRGSAGKGSRSPNILSENSYLFASSRQMYFLEKAKMEEAWNYGINITQRYTVLKHELTISTDFYRTDFKNQLIVDMDRDATAIYFYNLKGDSYSNSFQVELSYQPLNNLDVTLAYRANDVKTTINDELQQKPLVSRYKGLLSLGYKTPLKKWQFDYTIQLNGDGRIPITDDYPAELQQPSSFSSYTIMNFQVTKLFRKWDMYLGIENLTNFRQHNPIISASDPYSPYFDASMVWGPITGRKIYAGIRMLIWK